MSGIQQEVQRAALAPESAFATPPDFAAAGLWIPASAGFLPQNTRAVRQRRYASGRNVRNKHWLGRAGASINLSCDLHGYPASQLTDGQPPPDETWLDVVLASVLGAPIEHNADTCLAGTSATQVVLTDAATVGQLVAVRAAAVNGGRAQWASLAGGGPYTVDPDFAANPGTGAIMAAGRTYYPRFLPGTSLDVGPSYAVAVDTDDEHRLYTGCRMQSFQIQATAGEDVLCSVGHMADSEVVGAIAGIPEYPFAAQPEPCFQTYAPVVVNGVDVDYNTISFDLRATVRERKAGNRNHARSDWRVKSVMPQITIDPIHDLDQNALFEAGTVFSLMVVFGRAELANSRLNSLAIYFPAAQVVQPVALQAGEDDIRDQLVIEPADIDAAIPWAIGIV